MSWSSTEGLMSSTHAAETLIRGSLNEEGYHFEDNIVHSYSKVADFYRDTHFNAQSLATLDHTV